MLVRLLLKSLAPTRLTPRRLDGFGKRYKGAQCGLGLTPPADRLRGFMAASSILSLRICKGREPRVRFFQLCHYAILIDRSEFTPGTHDTAICHDEVDILRRGAQHDRIPWIAHREDIGIGRS